MRKYKSEGNVQIVFDGSRRTRRPSLGEHSSDDPLGAFSDPQPSSDIRINSPVPSFDIRPTEIESRVRCVKGRLHRWSTVIGPRIHGTAVCSMLTWPDFPIRMCRTEEKTRRVVFAGAPRTSRTTPSPCLPTGRVTRHTVQTDRAFDESLDEASREGNKTFRIVHDVVFVLHGCLAASSSCSWSSASLDVLTTSKSSTPISRPIPCAPIPMANSAAGSIRSMAP